MWISRKIYKQLLALLERPYLYDIEKNGNLVTFYFIKGKDVYQFTAMESDNIERIIN
jgi:hypothetical protein